MFVNLLSYHHGSPQVTKSIFTVSVRDSDDHPIEDFWLELEVTSYCPVLVVNPKEFTFYPKDIGQTVEKTIIFNK